MRRTAAMALGLLAFTAAGASAQDIPGLLLGRVPLSPLAAEITDETRTATFGGALFSQQARVTEVAQLQSAATVRIRAPTGEIRESVGAGELLYRVELNQAQPPHAFCSFDPTVVQNRPSGPMSRPSETYRFCLGDIDGDGDFDNLYIMNSSLAGRRVDGVWTENLPALVSGGEMIYAGAMETPVSYTILTDHNAEPVTLQLILTPAFDGFGAYLVTARENGGWTQLDSQNFQFEGAPPTTVDLFGARIEVLSREGRSITYRVVRGFPEGETIRAAIIPVPAIPTPARAN